MKETERTEDRDSRLLEGVRRRVEAARRDVLPPERVERVVRRVVTGPPPPGSGGALGGAGIGRAGLGFLAGVAVFGGVMWFGFGRDGPGERVQGTEPPRGRPEHEVSLGEGDAERMLQAPRLSQGEERAQTGRSREEAPEGDASGPGRPAASGPAARARGRDGTAVPARPMHRVAGERPGRSAEGRAGERTRSRPDGPGGGAGTSSEYELLLRARVALRQGRPAEALRGLREHRRRHPRGLLRLEREVMRVEALAALGREREARRLAERLWNEPGTESYRHRLRAALRSLKRR